MNRRGFFSSITGFCSYLCSRKLFSSSSLQGIAQEKVVHNVNLTEFGPGSYCKHVRYYYRRVKGKAEYAGTDALIDGKWVPTWRSVDGEDVQQEKSND